MAARVGSFRIVISFLVSDDPLLRWRAIEALGKVSREKAQTELDQVREIIRRLLWGMNDESGNFILHAPEAIAEILCNVPRLIGEYAQVFSSYRDVPPLQPGVYWGIARLATVQLEAFSKISADMIQSLKSDNPLVRACAAAALVGMDVKLNNESSDLLQRDDQEFEDYDFGSGDVRTTTVWEFYRATMSAR